MSNQDWRPGQPFHIDITEVNPHKKQTYSKFGNGGGYEVKDALQPINHRGFGMPRMIKNSIIEALSAQYEKSASRSMSNTTIHYELSKEIFN